MPVLNYPSTDVEHSFVSCEINLGGVVLVGLTQFTYGDNMEWADVLGTTGQVIAHARGQYKSKDFSMTVNRSLFDAWIAQLGENWRVLQYTAQIHRRTEGFSVQTDFIDGLRMMDLDTDASASSADPLQIKKTFKTRGVRWNGKLPFRGYRF